MKRTLTYMVILLTLYCGLSSSGICENTKYTSEYQNKTAYVGKTMTDKDLKSKVNTINEEMNTILPNLELETMKLEKGRKFIVVSDRNMNNTSENGIPVRFESVQKEYIAYDKTPSKVVFQGKIEKTGKPRFAGKSGTIKIKLEKITIDKITYPVNALISKIDNKAVHGNTLSTAPIYLANLTDAATNGTINSGWKDPCNNHYCNSGGNLTRPLIYLSAAALQAADLLIAPLTSLFKTGNDVIIPEKTYFEIKLNKDMFVLGI